MKVLLKQARILCKTSPHHGQLKDVLIEAGKINTISNHIDVSADQVIEQENLHVSLGWVDSFALVPDPGAEQKETLATGAAAAAAGGFTTVMLMPNSNPPVASKTQVEYLSRQAQNFPVTVLPIGAITKNLEGKELAEMYDMHRSGVVAFSEGTDALQSPWIMLKALQYVLPLKSVIIQVPSDKSLSAHGLMNEGITSTRIGLPGTPAIAEEIMLARDIELLRYTGSSLHITGLTTRKSIALLKQAKKEGLTITASATPYHCYFSDDALENCDTNLKVNPPIRSEIDRTALLEAFMDGTIDTIASHHNPQHWDDKTCEFEYAKYGMEGFESVFPVMNKLGVPVEDLVEKMTRVPREIFGLPMPALEEGADACLTLFNPETEYEFTKEKIRSASGNNAFIGEKLKGKIIGIINKNSIVIN